jgi:hypothetical protein
MKILVQKRTICRAVGRVARWYIFKTKKPIWVNFGGSYNVNCWYIFWQFGIFCVYFVHFSVFGMFYQEKSGNPGCRFLQRWR